MKLLPGPMHPFNTSFAQVEPNPMCKSGLGPDCLDSSSWLRDVFLAITTLECGQSRTQLLHVLKTTSKLAWTVITRLNCTTSENLNLPCKFNFARQLDCREVKCEFLQIHRENLPLFSEGLNIPGKPTSLKKKEAVAMARVWLWQKKNASASL